MSQNELTTFLCLFHKQDRAEAAINALETAGFNRNAVISLGAKDDGTQAASLREELLDLGTPERDLQHLQDGISRGGVVLSLEAAESRTEEIERIFHRYSAEKFDEVEGTSAGYGAAAALPLAAPVAPVSATQAEQVTVPVVEEDLVVGKRQVERGGVRVFSRTVEEPVSESVSLHEEHVVMERRRVDRAVTQADLRSGDQVIELVETEEVPVVSKVARVVEEVQLGVVGTDRTETVTDTVRHTEVDVEPVVEESKTTATLPSTSLNDPTRRY